MVDFSKLFTKKGDENMESVKEQCNCNDWKNIFKMASDLITDKPVDTIYIYK